MRHQTQQRAVKIFSTETTQIYFSHLNGFFPSLVFTTPGREGESQQDKHPLFLALISREYVQQGKRDKYRNLQLFFLKNKTQTDKAALLSFSICSCALLFSNLAMVIALEKPFLAQW